jgi:type II secretory pathway pseudopilin PulG
MTPISTSRKHSAGFSLVEVVLALGVVSAAVLALIGILGSTFTSAREIALQHRAINAITQIDGALQSASGIVDLQTGDPADSPFNRIYKALATKGALDGTNFVDFFVYQKTQETADNKPTPAVSFIFLPASGQFTLIEAKTDPKHDGIDTASVFRMRVRLSQLLKGKMYKLNPATYEADSAATWAVGQSLSATPDEYALAYLPLSVEIYPHDFTDATNPGAAAEAATTRVLPLLTSPVVINR